jgi:glycosyltransferase involved in cell wall biosynthesis
MRILALIPRSVPLGGGELVAVWMLEALKAEHELSVLAWEPLDLAEVNRFYGTALRADELTMIEPRRYPRTAVVLRERIGLRAHPIQRYQMLMWEARRLAANFDLIVSACDEADLGRPGIQYIHQPWSHHALGAVPVTVRSVRWRVRPWMLLSGYSVQRMRANITLTNSRWSAAEIERTLAIPAEVLRPPVPGRFRPRPWEQREQAVAVVSRFVPEKQIEMAIDAVRLLREDGEELRMHLIGSARHSAGSPYAARLRRYAAAEPWLELHEDLSRSELVELLCRCRYGLHPMANEPFGIAVGEMVRAGCIPLTRRSGGAVEIVPDDRLRFDSPAEAAERLQELTASSQLRAEIGAQLERWAEALTEEGFAREMRALVARTEQQRTSHPSEHAAVPDR